MSLEAEYKVFSLCLPVPYNTFCFAKAIFDISLYWRSTSVKSIKNKTENPTFLESVCPQAFTNPTWSHWSQRLELGFQGACSRYLFGQQMEEYISRWISTQGSPPSNTFFTCFLVWEYQEGLHARTPGWLHHGVSEALKSLTIARCPCAKQCEMLHTKKRSERYRIRNFLR